MRTAIAELEAGARDQILHRAGDEHFVGTSDGGDSRADVYRDADYAAVAYEFALTGV